MSRPSKDTSAFEVEVSLDPSVPMVVTDTTRALTYVIVTRESQSGLDSEWDASGVYVLLQRVGQGVVDGKPIPEGEWQGYVGKATGLRGRLRDHNRTKEFWATAVLVRRDVSQGFNDAHLSWLEHKIHNELSSLAGVHLHNGNTPPRASGLNKSDQRMVENAAEGVLYVLAMAGYRAAPENRHTTEPSTPVLTSPTRKQPTIRSVPTPGSAGAAGSTRKTNAVTVLLQNSAIPEGTLLAINLGIKKSGTPSAHSLTQVTHKLVTEWIAENPSRGKATWLPQAECLRWEMNGETYSPTGLAEEIYRRACNDERDIRGTSWWLIPGGETLNELADRYR